MSDFFARLQVVGLISLFFGACAAVTPSPGPGGQASQPALPDLFQSEDFIVAVAKPGDTSESLAAKFLEDSGKAWMIEEYNGMTALSPGEQVVIPKRFWNLAGVDPSGYQLVPVLCYHNIAPHAKERLTIALKTFQEQMRYLKAQGFHVVSLSEFYEFISLKRQLPHKSLVLSFDDGYKSFLQYAYPVLKELGFTATLFVYTDYIGAGRNALSWADLKKLAEEGFQVEAHTKTHGDLRRKAGESNEQYARRIRTELDFPRILFQKNLGQTPQVLAYPYGAQDNVVVEKTKEDGYIAAFTVHREGNPSFVDPLRIHRSQIYSQMSLEDFIKNLNFFDEESFK